MRRFLGNFISVFFCSSGEIHKIEEIHFFQGHSTASSFVDQGSYLVVGQVEKDLARGNSA